MSRQKFGWCCDYRKTHPEFEHVQCCNSCHEDHNEGYDMCGEIEDDVYYELCCTLASAKDKDRAK